MSNYLRPDVYVQEQGSTEKPIQAVSTSIGAFVGETARGVVGKPLLVTSWTDFCNKFALGLDTPFTATSDVAHAVYGFFQNGGSQCYVVRVASPSCSKAKCVTTSDGLEIYAKDEGAWANNRLKVKVTASAKSQHFDISVYMANTLVETIEEVSNSASSNNYFKNVINEVSKYLEIKTSASQSLVATDGIVEMTGGDDSRNSITNNDFVGTKGLKALDTVEINLVAIPRKSSEKAIATELIGYADNRNDCFAVIDPPVGADLEAIQTFRTTLGGTNGALYYPNGYIIDPLGRNAKSLRVCPPCGHIMGIMARTDSSKGVYKAPAGEDCVVRGFVSLETDIPVGMMDILNPKAINCIIAKPNKGIIVWGARSLSSDPAKRYVSDVRYDLMVRNSVHEGIQFAVFEPNNEDLWNKVDTSLRSFLDLQWRGGALRGSTAEEAYYVKCDSELNTDDVINAGQLVAEIGYAKQKPAEFVIVKIVQKQAN